MKATHSKNNNEILFRQLPSQEQMSYYYFAPKTVKSVLILVHGISRNAKEIIKAFKPLAEKNQVLLIAPIFKKGYAKDYQRLGRNGKGPRSDYQLMGIIKDCKSLTNIQFNKFNLFGFSAGAQFAHRFTFAHPNLINKVALVAAGWYTLPTKHLAYPSGLKLKKEFNDIAFIPKRFLRTKYRVYIGEKDNKRDASLNKNSIIDETQGLNRLERAISWIELMQLHIQKHGIKNHIELEILPNSSHDFVSCVNNANLHIQAMKWLNDE